MTSQELLPDYFFEREFCSRCGDEVSGLKWDENDELICPYCEEIENIHRSEVLSDVSTTLPVTPAGGGVGEGEKNAA